MFKHLTYILNVKFWIPKLGGTKVDKVYLGVWMLLFYTVFSGALRKWVVGPGAIGNVLLLLQLFLPLLLYWFITAGKLPGRRKAPVFWPFYLAYLVLTALNPMNNTLYHGAFGLLLHTGYWLIWLAYLQVGQWMRLERLVPALIVILIIEFLLASAQYALPGSHILNIQAAGEAMGASVGDAVRVAGTFSYLGGFQVFIPLIACLAWFMLLQRYDKGLIFLVLGLGLLMAFMSGSRGAVGFFIMHTIVALFLSGNFAATMTKLMFQGILFGVLLFATLPPLQKLAVRSFDNFMYRFENSDQLDERIAGSYDGWINFKGNYPIVGVGLGATYQGANALFGTSKYVQEYGGYESEPARIILEGGFVLFFLRFILAISFLSATRYLPLTAKVFFLIILFNGMLTFNVYQGVFFVLGVILVDRGYYLRLTNKIKV